jgi:SAM-dependent methyltransferase
MWIDRAIHHHPRVGSGGLSLVSNLRELRALRRRYEGVLWRHPAVSAAFPLLDAADGLVRRNRGLEHLPPYSVRVRSASMVGEFGGKHFASKGRRVRRTLIDHAALRPDDRVLEVGCGAGRIALALADYLEPGGYVGFDIDEVSIRACRQAPELGKFEFFVADVANEVYRPHGSLDAAAYRFPLDDAQFDVIFLASVFTHMLEDECANYAREMLRVVKPGGRIAISTYLRTPAVPGQPHSFAHPVGSAHVEYADNPAKLVAYDLATFERWFAGASVRGLRGGWRGSGEREVGGWQDWVIVHADAGPG